MVHQPVGDRRRAEREAARLAQSDGAREGARCRQPVVARGAIAANGATKQAQLDAALQRAVHYSADRRLLRRRRPLGVLVDAR